MLATCFMWAESSCNPSRKKFSESNLAEVSTGTATTSVFSGLAISPASVLLNHATGLANR